MGNWFEHLTKINTDEEKNDFKKNILDEGFSAINDLINGFKEKLKLMDEDEFKLVKTWLELIKELLPDVTNISPAWDRIWEHLLHIYSIKVNLYHQVSKENRDGEWQVLFDNPLSTDEIVCHPKKTFQEATYIMAKYQQYLKKAEYVRLQKMITYITEEGK